MRAGPRLTSEADFINAVAVAGRMSPEEAEAALRQVLRSLSRACGSGACDELLQILPAGLAAELNPPVESDPYIDREIFVGRMIQSYPTEYGYDQTLGGMDLVSVYLDDDAAWRTRAAFSVLRGQLSAATVESLAAALPAEISHWWQQQA